MNSWTGAIVFSAKCTIGMVWGLSSKMVFDRLPSISLALRAFHEKGIQSKPFMFAQNFQFVNAFQSSSAVHGVILSSRCNAPWNQY